MYTVTNEYETYVKSEARNYSMTGSIVNKNNVTMQITRDNILEGSLSFTNRCTANNSFDIGGCCIGSMEITLQGDYHHSLYNAVITLQQGVYVTGDSYHMEKVGTWIIKKAHWNGEWVTLECYDAMCLTQKKYTLTTGSFTPYSFFTAMCNDCGITLATTQAEIEAMVNGTATLIFNGSTQETDRKWSDLIHDMCAVICGFCCINRFGNLEVHQFGRCYKRIGTEKTYYTAAVDTLTKDDRITGGSFGNGAINITGLYINDRASKNADKSILVGNTTGTTLNLGYNRWLSSATSGYATMLQNILTQLTACQFYAADVHLADVSLYDLGDLITLQAGGELSLSEDILICVMNIDYNFADESTISSYTFSEASDSSTSAVETNLTNRIETLESSDSGKEVHTSTADPSITDGNNDNVWFKYTLEAGLKFNNGAIYPDKWYYMGCFRGEYTGYGEGWCYIWANNYPIPQDVNTGEGYLFPFLEYNGGARIVKLGIRCHKDRYAQIVDTAAVTFYVISKAYPLGRYFTGEWMYCDMDANYQLYLGIKSLRASTVLWGVALPLFTHEIDVTRQYVAIDGVSTLTNIAKRTNAEWVKINGEWVLVSEDIGSEVVVTQTLTEGTEIGEIEVSGNSKKLYAPTPQSVSVTQTQTSGTEIATLNVGDASTKLYAPETTVTQTLTEGTEIGEVNGTKLYAPTGGGSDVTVTPITTTGTNIADIEVNGATYQLFAPTSGGGGGHNYSTTEQVIGTWIDGSTLYEKTFTGSFSVTTTSRKWYDIYSPEDLADLHIDKCMFMNGLYKEPTQSFYIDMGVMKGNDGIYCSMLYTSEIGIRFVVQNGATGTGEFIFTIQYTKTS